MATATSVLATPVAVNLALAEEDSPIRFGNVDAKEETVLLLSDEKVDLTGYSIEFEYKQEVSQRRQFPNGTTIGPDDPLTIGTGAKYASADLSFDYEAEVINNDYDRLAILDAEGNVVATTTVGESETDEGSSDGSDGNDSEGTPDESTDNSDSTGDSGDTSGESADDSEGGDTSQPSDSESESTPDVDENEC